MSLESPPEIREKRMPCEKRPKEREIRKMREMSEKRPREREQREKREKREKKKKPHEGDLDRERQRDRVMIHDSHISRSYSNTLPNEEIRKGFQGHLKLEHEDLAEIMRSFENKNPSFETIPSMKETNPLGNCSLKTFPPHSLHTHYFWLHHLGIDTDIVDSIQNSIQSFDSPWPTPINQTNNSRRLYPSICTPNAPGQIGFRRLQLHKESETPAIHYKPTLRNGAFSWSENFNFHLPPPTHNTSPSEDDGTSPSHYYQEPLRAAPTALKNLITERSHLLNLSDGTYYIGSGKPVYPGELNHGEHVLRIASAFLQVDGISRDSLFKPRRNQSNPHLESQPSRDADTNSKNPHRREHFDSTEDFSDSGNIISGNQGVYVEESDPPENEFGGRKRKVQFDVDNSPTSGYVPPPIVNFEDIENMNPGTGDQNIPNVGQSEDEYYDLVGCAQYQALENSLGRHLEGMADAVVEMVLSHLSPYADILAENQQGQGKGEQKNVDPHGEGNEKSKEKKSQNKTDSRKRSKCESESEDTEFSQNEEEEFHSDHSESSKDGLVNQQEYSKLSPFDRNIMEKVFGRVEKGVRRIGCVRYPKKKKAKIAQRQSHRNHRRGASVSALHQETNRRLNQKNQNWNEATSYFSWEHVLGAVQQSADSLIQLVEQTSPSSISLEDGIETKDGDVDEAKLEDMFFHQINEGSNENNLTFTRATNLEISPLLPPLHLTPSVVQRIQTRLIALFGLSRETGINGRRSNTAFLKTFDYCSPGYPKST